MKSHEFLLDAEVKATERLPPVRVALAALDLVAPKAVAEAAVEWIRRLGDLGRAEEGLDGTRRCLAHQARARGERERQLPSAGAIRAGN